MYTSTGQLLGIQYALTSIYIQLFVQDQDQDQEILFQLGKTFSPETTFQGTQCIQEDMLQCIQEDIRSVTGTVNDDVLYSKEEKQISCPTVEVKLLGSVRVL